MQGGHEGYGVPVSGPAGEAGPDPLPPAAGGRRADGRGPSTLRDSTPSCPHPGELSGGWGEFEGFRESSAQSQQLSPSFELLGSGPSAPKERGSRQGGPWGPGTAAAASPFEEPLLSHENAFRFAFQEVPVEQAPEDICSLDRFLEISCEENPGLASVPRLCSESRKLWRALQNTDTVPSSPCLWSESRCRENLFPILGIDPAQKSLSGGQSHVLEGSDLREPEELLAVSSFHLHRCKTLIPAKLSGTPGNTQGRLITYSLFLKTPPHGNGHCITIPRKKIFTPRSLKMAFFNNGVW